MKRGHIGSDFDGFLQEDGLLAECEAGALKRWARRLTRRVGKVLAAHPHADPDNVRHTLILLNCRRWNDCKGA